MEYKCKTPCNNCPYRKDSKLQHWAREEFIQLLENDSQQFGKTYGCHKNNGTVCRGWLMMQDKNNFPSLSLRISLSKNNVDRVYLDALHCKSEMYDTVEEMIKTNYPELKIDKI